MPSQSEANKVAPIPLRTRQKPTDFKSFISTKRPIIYVGKTGDANPANGALGLVILKTLCATGKANLEAGGVITSMNSGLTSARIARWILTSMGMREVPVGVGIMAKESRPLSKTPSSSGNTKSGRKYQNAKEYMTQQCRDATERLSEEASFTKLDFINQVLRVNFSTNIRHVPINSAFVCFFR
jgi:hypothetical protein